MATSTRRVPPPKTRAEVMAQCDVNAVTGCWNWRRSSAEGPARRVWTALNGEIPHGQHVLHSCDNRLCANPTHLYLGTVQQNARDRQARGRQGRGAEFEGRLSVRLSLDDLTYLAKVGAAVGQDSSWAVRWAVGYVRSIGAAPLLRTVTPDAARKGGAV